MPASIYIESPTNFFELAKLHILRNYGDVVEFYGDFVHGVGRADSLGTSETEINPLNQNETYLGSNLIDTVSSSNAGDTQELHVEGMTISGNVFTKVTQTVTLTGQTKATLTTPLARVTHFENHGATDLAGDVYIYEDTAIVAGVPTDLSKAHDMIPAAALPNASDNNSLKSAISTPSNQYLLFHHFYANVNKKTAASVDLRIKTRPLGETFKTRYPGSTSNTQGQLSADFEPFLIVPPNADLSVTAICSTTGVDVSAGYFAFIAEIVTGANLVKKTRPWI